jgi:hypothetical protein
LFCTVVGTTWDLQFFFTAWVKPDGEVQVLESGPAHGQHYHLQHSMGDWIEGVDRYQRPHQASGGLSLLPLVGSTVVVGYGNYLGAAN